jgi:hypothetical protein
MTITPGRLVAILTPVLFAPLAGSISVLAARYLPGVDIDQGSLQAIFIAGATIAFGKAALWLKGWQDWEKRQESAPVADVDLPVHDDAAEGAPDFDADEPDFDDSDEPDFDDSDLDELLAAPAAAGNEG